MTHTPLIKQDFIKDHLGPHRQITCDQQLGYYLAGLIEGDGYFGPTKLEIAYHMKDKSAAYLLRSRLGFGQIYNYSAGRQAVRFVISNKKGLKYVLDLVNGKFVSPLKVNQLIKHGYALRFNMAILPPLKSVTFDNHWLAGFLDADGSLGIFIVASDTHKHGKCARLEVKISQKDYLSVSLIGSMFKVNKIYQDKTDQIYKLNHTGASRIKLIVGYLDQYHLQTMKYTQYTIFRRCARFIQNKKHLLPGGLVAVSNFKRQLQNVYKNP